MKSQAIFLAAALMAAAALAVPPEHNPTPAVKRASLNVLRVASAVVDGETVTIGTTVFEVDTAADPGAITAGRIRVNCSAAQTATAFCTAFEAAVNTANVQGFRVGASKISASEVLLLNYVAGDSTLAATETLAGTNNAFASATFYGGANALESTRGSLAISRVANATEAALETMHFVAPFVPVAAIVQVRTTAGVLKAFDGAVTIAGAVVNVNSSGTTDVAATDIVTVLVSE